MAIRNYKESERQDGGPTWWDHFDELDLAEARKGNSDQQILSQLQAGGYSPWGSGEYRIGPKVWQELGGSWNLQGEQLGGSTGGSTGGNAPPVSNPTGGSSYSAGRDYSQAFKNIRGRLKQTNQRLDQTKSEYQKYKENAQAEYQTIAGQLAESNTKIEGLNTDLSKVKTDADLYKTKLESYRNDAASQQLDSLRRGTSFNQGPSGGATDLASGTSAVNRGAPSRRESMVDVSAEVSATDSVLDRRGPVVEVIGSGSSANRVEARQRALAAGGGRSAASYYASRFG